jgi:hypothetical protein
VTITSEAFVTLGQGVAQHLGMPDLPFVVIPHPVAHRSTPDLHDAVDGVIGDIVAALTSPGTPS